MMGRRTTEWVLKGRGAEARQFFVVELTTGMRTVALGLLGTCEKETGVLFVRDREATGFFMRAEAEAAIRRTLSYSKDEGHKPPWNRKQYRIIKVRLHA